MTLFQSEIKYFLRSPIIWLILSLTAFLSAWSFLLSIELFTALQVKFAGMSDAPTITQGILTPFISSQAKILVFITSIIGGLSYARLSHNNGWSLLHLVQYSEFKIVWQKYTALIMVCFLFILPALIAIISLIIISDSQWLPTILMSGGLVLLMLWMVALTMMLSSFFNNSGFAILLSLIVLMALLLITQSGLGAEWGKNYLQIISPFYQFFQFSKNTIPIASIAYFVFGIMLFLFVVKVRITQKRHIL
jgi:ABC-type transport system involved in multi-copper enzyme maturation permease subunit